MEGEDIRLHDEENEMRGEGRGMIGGCLKLYTKATSSIKTEDKGSNTVIPFYDHHKSRLVETMTFWAEYHGGFKGFSPNEFFEWEDSHPLCSNALSPSGSVMITKYTKYKYSCLPVRL